jgi:hypothetical protein
MRIPYWITKTTDTHSEYVILIGFPRQQWLREGASVLLLYVYILSFQSTSQLKESLKHDYETASLFAIFHHFNF